MANITTNEIMDTLQNLMQMTSDGFLRLETKIDKLDRRMAKAEDTLSDHTAQLITITRRLQSIEDKLEMHSNDIKDILTILDDLSKKVNINEEERRLAAITLQHLVEWAQVVAKKIDVPLKLS